MALTWLHLTPYQRCAYSPTSPLQAFPPRGGLHLLGAAHASMSAIERWIAEEAILDTLTSFEGNRCAGVEVLR